MKIDFISATAKNFMSIGSNPVEINYEKGLHRIVGQVIGEDTKNGVGKSIIVVDIIIFALYGKSIRNINLDQIVNSINGQECEVSLRFKINETIYRIERGIKPNYLRFINEQDEANGIKKEESIRKKSTQNDINDTLKIDMTTMVNVITMNINYSKPFFKLTPPEKRKIIEDCTNVSIYGKMFEIIKKQYNEMKTDKKVLLSELTNLKDYYKEKLQTFEKFEALKNEFETTKQKDISLLEEKINKNTTILNELKSKIPNKDYISIKNELLNKKSVIDGDVIKLSQELKYINKDNDKLNFEINDLKTNPICPRCKTPNTSDHTVGYITELEEKISVNNSNKVTIDNKLISLKEDLTKISDDLKIVNTNIEKLSILNQRIQQVSNVIENDNENLITLKNKQFQIKELITTEDLEKSKDKLEIKEKEYNDLEKDMTYADYLKEILGDGGIKTYIIKKIVPVLNKKLNEYLSIFNFNHSVTFDNELNEIVKCRKRDILSYNNCSSGEQRRMDFAMMFALLYLNKNQLSINCNLLVLDEVLDTSLCKNGTYQLMEFLKTDFKKEQPNLCTYVISHKEEISNNNFDTIINVIKENDFTKIKSIDVMDRILY